MSRRPLFLVALAPLLLANADPLTIPPQIRAMLETAFASGNEGDVATLVKYAITAAPDDAAAIRALSDAWLAQRRADRQTVIERAGLFDLWKGRAELGGWITTGNSPDRGVTAVLDLAREGPRWRQKLKLQLDYQETNDVETRRHYLASYEPNYKISDRGYIYGATQYESDRFAGYRDRYSGSIGAGYSVLRGGPLTLNLELGPAYRHTIYTEAPLERGFAGRGSLDFGWKLSPGLTITQVASAYVQHYNSTLTGTTALNARLIGPLSAQLSYAIQHESEPAVGLRGTDTTSRASLVYSF